jgi:hypothetical protein
MLFNLTLTDDSSMTISGCALTVTASINCNPLYITSGVMITHRSNLSLAQSNVTSTLIDAFYIHSSPITVQYGSASSMANMTATGSVPFTFWYSPITVQYNSAWNIIQTSLTSTSYAFLIYYSAIIIQHDIAWIIMQANMTSLMMAPEAGSPPFFFLPTEAHHSSYFSRSFSPHPQKTHAGNRRCSGRRTTTAHTSKVICPYREPVG